MAKAAAAIAITVLVLCSGCASKHYADPSCPAVLGQVSTVPPDARQAVHELASLPALVTPGTRLASLANRVISELEMITGQQPGGLQQAETQYISLCTRLSSSCMYQNGRGPACCASSSPDVVVMATSESVTAHSPDSRKYSGVSRAGGRHGVTDHTALGDATYETHRFVR